MESTKTLHKRGRMGRVAAIAAAAGMAVVLGGGGAAVSPATLPALTLQTSYRTAQGNAGHVAWSDDGTTLFLANEEGVMPAVKIDATNPSAPSIVATAKPENFLYADAQRNGLLVFQPSLGSATVALDPATFAIRWGTNVGASHAIATDGTHVFVPVEGKPGSLVMLSSTGTVMDRVSVPDGLSRVYAMTYDPATRHLYVGSAADASKGIPGGIYIYVAQGGGPAYLGRIAQPAWNIAASGARLWTAVGATLQAWNVGAPGSPTLIGSWTGAPVTLPVSLVNQRGVTVIPQLGGVAVNAAGTRLYVDYQSVDAVTRRVNPLGGAGFMIFDVSKSTPVALTNQGLSVQAFNGDMRPYWESPSALALSPDGRTLAVAYWEFGVALYNVASDATTALGRVATAGESHDVYVDSGGVVYDFDNDVIQAFNPATRTFMSSTPFATQVDGGWKPFRDGRVVLPGAHPVVAGFQKGTISFWQPLPSIGITWDDVFDGTYLYSGGDTGTITVSKIGVTTAGTYTATVVGSVRVPRADGTYGSAPLNALALRGTAVWALGQNVGVVAVDVSTPTAPRLLYRDAFTFNTNGTHDGLVVAQNRIYAGVGASGLLIYDPAKLVRTGSLAGLNVNFLDILNQQSINPKVYLVVSNYWYAKSPDGTYVYDITGNPDVPVLTAWFPQPQGGANFRARSISGAIYRAPLYGIDVLAPP
ncbi:MAG TPA: hypothetical protein VKT83_10790 [bacterium]|nr:hypothetical protein [bacterium]